MAFRFRVSFSSLPKIPYPGLCESFAPTTHQLTLCWWRWCLSLCGFLTLSISSYLVCDELLDDEAKRWSWKTKQANKQIWNWLKRKREALLLAAILLLVLDRLLSPFFSKVKMYECQDEFQIPTIFTVQPKVPYHGLCEWSPELRSDDPSTHLVLCWCLQRLFVLTLSIHVEFQQEALRSPGNIDEKVARKDETSKQTNAKLANKGHTMLQPCSSVALCQIVSLFWSSHSR